LAPSQYILFRCRSGVFFFFTTFSSVFITTGTSPDYSSLSLNPPTMEGLIIYFPLFLLRLFFLCGGVATSRPFPPPGCLPLRFCALIMVSICPHQGRLCLLTLPLSSSPLCKPSGRLPLRRRITPKTPLLSPPEKRPTPAMCFFFPPIRFPLSSCPSHAPFTAPAVYVCDGIPLFL